MFKNIFVNIYFYLTVLPQLLREHMEIIKNYAG